eukprot:GFKZ01014964.1.p1 GENE.GFKZ01014964.1~~GFKZ01014964.1.p1  ORF type:complete len:371 (+),score=39.35 GFKZ01014964.1:264-1376(+)
MLAPTDIPSFMTAAVLVAHGGPSQLQINQHVPVPTPSTGEVLVRVSACSVNNTDINTRLGWYHSSIRHGTQPPSPHPSPTHDATWQGKPMRFPRIQGADIVGHVVALGPNVPPYWLSARVIVDPCLRPTLPAPNPYDSFHYIGSERDGGFAQFAAVPLANCFRIAPDCPWTDVQLATVPCAYGTAENMLEHAGVGKEHVVLVTGASGGVGAAAVKLAKRRGCVVVAVTSKREEVRRLGADAVVGRDGDWGEALDRFGPLDVVLDVVGGRMFGKFFQHLRRGGTYVVSGAIAGKMVEVDLSMLYLRDWKMIGCTMTSREMFERLVGYVERGEIQPGLTKTYELKNIAAAQQEFNSKTFAGKLVLIPPPAKS